jgi:hypothetical protein
LEGVVNIFIEKISCLKITEENKRDIKKAFTAHDPKNTKVENPVMLAFSVVERGGASKFL